MKIPLWLIIALVGAGIVLGLLVGHHYGGLAAEKELSDFKRDNIAEVIEKIVVQEKIVNVVETKEVEKVVYRDKFLTKIEKVVEYVTEPLRQCIVPVDAVRLWNDARACALLADGASCTADYAVPDTSAIP